MRRAIPFALVVLLSLAVLSSCPNEPSLTHVLTIVNNSSRAIERVGLTYTGIKAPATNFEADVTVPPGQTETVDLTLDAASEYYVLFIWNITDTKRILWDGAAVGYEYVRLSKGGSSTCTVEVSGPATVAGENHVNPSSYDWN